MKTHKDKISRANYGSTRQLRLKNTSNAKINSQSLDQRQEQNSIRLIQKVADTSQGVTQLQSLQNLADISQLVAQRNVSLDELEEPTQLVKNNTGLPDQLKMGMESISGHSLDHVKVHYNSSKPAALQAHAYAQGNEIHLGAGQQQHLPHELGHVVQQMEGRVQPTLSVDGVAINDDKGLEREADTLGKQALEK